jgi:dephospho-CoA kinase
MAAAALPVLRIGLTGGIGSGKSTVARLLAAQGAAVIDTDAIARQLTLPGGAAMPAIAEAFGPGMLAADGALDRQRMRTLVFEQPSAKRQLEAILHPMIGAETARQADAAVAAGASVLVFDVPLLVESGHWRARVDRVLVVDCTADTQVARVMARSGWTDAAVRAVIAQQATREQRRAVADAVILNDGITLAALSDAVNALWQRWCGPLRVKQSNADH